MTPPNVAFCRPLRKGVRGGDVVAHKRAIHRAMPDSYTVGTYTNYFGERFENAVRAFQRKHDIQATGKIGGPTHEKLERTHKQGADTWAFDEKAASLAKDFCDDYATTPEERIRDAIVSAGFFWYSHRGTITYSQHRPFQIGKPPWYPSRWDCSGFVTACYFAGDALNPNGRPWDGLGYTGTLLTRGRPVAHVTDLEIADLIFYGMTTNATPAFPYGSPTHVALYVGLVNGAHSVLSMGSYPMRLLPYNYRSVNHLRTYEVV